MILTMLSLHRTKKIFIELYVLLNTILHIIGTTNWWFSWYTCVFICPVTILDRCLRVYNMIPSGGSSIDFSCYLVYTLLPAIYLSDNRDWIWRRYIVRSWIGITSTRACYTSPSLFFLELLLPLLLWLMSSRLCRL